MDANIFSRARTDDYEVENLSDSDSEDWMSQLLRSPVIQQLPSASLQKLLISMEEQPVSAGDEVITQGDDGQFFYLLHQGTAQFSQENISEKTLFTREIAQGATFGEESLLSNKPRSGNVRMLTDGLLFKLNKEKFDKYIKEPLEYSITFEDAQQQIEAGWQWLDVRAPEQFSQNALPGAINAPIATLRDNMADMDQNTAYICYCNDGMISNTAVYLLRHNGFDAFLLTNGINANAATPQAHKTDSQKDLVTAMSSAEAHDIALLQKQVTTKDQTIAEQKASISQLKQTIRELEASLTESREQSAKIQKQLKMEIRVLKKIVEQTQP